MSTGLSFYLLPNIEIGDEWMVKRPIEAVRRTRSMYRKGFGRTSKKLQEGLREGFTPAFHGASVLSRCAGGIKISDWNGGSGRFIRRL